MSKFSLELGVPHYHAACSKKQVTSDELGDQHSKVAHVAFVLELSCLHVGIGVFYKDIGLHLAMYK